MNNHTAGFLPDSCQYACKDALNNHLVHMAAKKESNLKKWEHPKKSDIWIRELVYTKQLENKERTYSGFQITIPADRDLKRARQRKQFTTKAKAEK
jgi:hypothetical protein